MDTPPTLPAHPPRASKTEKMYHRNFNYHFTDHSSKVSKTTATI